MTNQPRAWETVLGAIEAKLASGELAPGGRLPPERQLAGDLGVGRSSIREAVRVLEALGLIRTATGSGPQSGAMIISTPSDGMSTLLRLQVAAQGFRVENIVKTRLMVETTVARDLAKFYADNAGPCLDGASRLLDAMDEPQLTEAQFLTLDAQFHLTLAESCGNEVVTAMMLGLRNSIEDYVIDAALRLPAWPETRARLRTEHRRILMAIYSGDADAATSLVHGHITGYYRESEPSTKPHAPLPLPALLSQTHLKEESPR